jgi:hypothetical protein
MHPKKQLLFNIIKMMACYYAYCFRIQLHLNSMEVTWAFESPLLFPFFEAYPCNN